MIVGAHLAVSLSSPSCYAVCGTVHESQPQGGLWRPTTTCRWSMTSLLMINSSIDAQCEYHNRPCASHVSHRSRGRYEASKCPNHSFLRYQVLYYFKTPCDSSCRYSRISNTVTLNDHWETKLKICRISIVSSPSFPELSNACGLKCFM